MSAIECEFHWRFMWGELVSGSWKWFNSAEEKKVVQIDRIISLAPAKDSSLSRGRGFYEDHQDDDDNHFWAIQLMVLPSQLLDSRTFWACSRRTNWRTIIIIGQKQRERVVYAIICIGQQLESIWSWPGKQKLMAHLRFSFASIGLAQMKERST